jgi:exopolysaccharide production protein ExoZ
VKRNDLAEADKPQVYLGLQVLRGIAALMVMTAHTELFWYMATSDPRAANFPANGALGVDIFFIISGFVVTYATVRRSGSTESAGTFIARRFLRIAPTYWLMSCVAVAILVWHHLQGEPISTYPSPIGYYILGSFLFLPLPLHGTISAPVLAVGWSLNIEMYFYVLFAFGLWLRASISRFIASSVLIVTLVIVIQAPSRVTGYGATMLCEFIAGVLLARYVILGGEISGRIAIPAGAVSALILIFVPLKMSFLTWRGLTCGPLAFFIVLAAISLENRQSWHWPKPLVALGTISYSLYLVHVPLAQVLMPVLCKVHIVRLASPTRLSHLIFVVTGIAFSLAAAVLFYRLAEKPTHDFARRRFPARQMAPADPETVQREAFI